MKYARTLILSLIVLLSACEQGLPDRTLGAGFNDVFLRSGDQVQPYAQLQVYLGDRIPASDYPAVSASLALDDGTTVAGTFAIDELHRLLVFSPLDVMPIDQALTLTIDGGPKTIAIDFTTSAPGAGVPPVVVIASPAGGAAVGGVTEVLATVTDDTFLVGKVHAAIDGVDFAWREDPPYLFYLNTAALSDGAHLLTVRAMDSDLLVGSTTVTIVVGTLKGFPITTEGLDLVSGVVPSSTLSAAMFPGVVLSVYSLRGDNYSSWSTAGLKVGALQGTTYTPADDFASAGVACLSFVNYTLTAFNLPASTLTLTLPDHSTQVVSLPATTVSAFGPGLKQVAFYVGVDGKVYWAHAAAGQVNASLPPDLSPAAALALPSPSP